MAYVPNRAINTYSSNTTISNLDSVVFVNAASAPVQITLPSSVIGKYFDIKKTDSSANLVTITPPSGTIDGAANVTISIQYASVTIIGDGSNFYIL